MAAHDESGFLQDVLKKVDQLFNKGLETLSLSLELILKSRVVQTQSYSSYLSFVSHVFIYNKFLIGIYFMPVTVFLFLNNGTVQEKFVSFTG